MCCARRIALFCIGVLFAAVAMAEESVPEDANKKDPTVLVPVQSLKCKQVCKPNPGTCKVGDFCANVCTTAIYADARGHEEIGFAALYWTR